MDAVPQSQGRMTGLLAIIGGVIWIVSWSGNILRELGVAALIELDERTWRLLLAPAIVLWLCALIAWHRRYTRRGGTIASVGFVTVLLALITMLAGNLIEYGIGDLIYEDVAGEWESNDKIGWIVMGLGFMLAPTGLVLLGLVSFTVRAISRWRAAMPLIFGCVMILLFVQGVVVLLLSGDSMQEGWMLTPIFMIGLGWIALGVALWTDPEVGGQHAG